MNDFNFAFSILSSVILLNHLSSSASASASKGIGNAICHVGGSLANCSSGDIPVNLFPKECTALVYESLDVTSKTVVDPAEKYRPKGYLDSLGGSNADVIVVYYNMDWPTAVKSIKTDQAATEVASWKTYLEKHTVITGLALSSIEPSDSTIYDAEYTQNLKSYIEVMRSNFPHLKIGIFVNSVTIVNTVGTPQITWLDLSCLEPCVDFFLASSSTNVDTNNCEPKYQFGENVPNERIEAVRNFLKSSKIPKEKIVFSFDGTPMNSKLNTCDLLYPNMCLNPTLTYCGGKLKNYYDDGAYCQTYGGGFGIYFIDTDDVYGCCQCNRTFPIFNALLDGFNGNPVPVCDLIDNHK